MFFFSDAVGRYKGKFYAWDVVNEVFDWNGQLRKSVWSRHLGERFIADAFRLAHAADPSAKLYISDYSIISVEAKYLAMYNMVKKLLADGVPIHGVGFQTDILLGANLVELQGNLKRITDLGVEVAITEIDIAIKLPSNESTLEQQAKNYLAVTSSCVNVKGCVGLSFSGFTDKHERISEKHPGYGDALLWDNDYKPKPAAYAVQEALK